jgi:hypothetical protein
MTLLFHAYATRHPQRVTKHPFIELLCLSSSPRGIVGPQREALENETSDAFSTKSCKPM